MTAAPEPDVNRDFSAAKAAMADWYVHEAARLTRPWELIRATCHRLMAVGVRLSHFSAFVLTLHPDYFGVAHRWDRESDKVQSTQGRHDFFETDTVQKNPISVAMTQGYAGLRRRLDRPGFVPDFPVLKDYAKEGVTDYVLMLMEFTDGRPQCITFATDRPGGFTTAELCLISDLLPHMARLTEIQAVRYLAATLISTYVGRDAGHKIMTGRIRRGDVEAIDAVIWLCDLRDFTTLSNDLPGTELIALLNEYFDCVGPPVREHGGEILKFIGDAMLAIFQIEAPANAAEACGHALAAADAALVNLATLQASRFESGKAAVRFGIALHVGEVLYGNVGTGDRLDFTVVGPAVNMAARLESLCRELGEPVVISADFAGHCDRPLDSLGRHALKGIDGTIEAFRPAPAATVAATQQGAVP